MSDNWQVGDLALLVNREAIHNCACGLIHTGNNLPTVGSVFRVDGLAFADGHVGLCIGRTDPRPVLSERFRKIRPLTDEERLLAEAEFKADRIITEPVGV